LDLSRKLNEATFTCERPSVWNGDLLQTGLVLIFLAEAQREQSTFSKPLKRSAPFAPARETFCLGSGFGEFYGGSGFIQLARQNPKICVLYEGWSGRSDLSVGFG